MSKFTDEDKKYFGDKVLFQHIFSKAEVARLIEGAYYANPVPSFEIGPCRGSVDVLEIVLRDPTTLNVRRIDLCGKVVTRDFELRRSHYQAEFDHTQIIKMYDQKFKDGKVFTDQELKQLWSYIDKEYPKIEILNEGLQIDSFLDYNEIVLYNNYGNFKGLNLSGLRIEYATTKATTPQLDFNWTIG